MVPSRSQCWVILFWQSVDKKKRAGVVLGFITDVWAVKKGEELSKSGAETPTSSPGLRLYDTMPHALVGKLLLVLPDPTL